MSAHDERFWETKTLDQMSSAEWESLCDGCGRCCLVLLIDEDNGETWETDVACKLYDRDARRCTDYENRQQRVPSCVKLTPQNAGALEWMPETCAYRRLARGQSLPDWHPLISESTTTTARAGVATKRSVLSEVDVDPDDLEDHVTRQRC